jgi:hypothetical protein
LPDATPDSSIASGKSGKSLVVSVAAESWCRPNDTNSPHPPPLRVICPARLLGDRVICPARLADGRLVRLNARLVRVDHSRGAITPACGAR